MKTVLYIFGSILRLWFFNMDFTFSSKRIEWNTIRKLLDRFGFLAVLKTNQFQTGFKLYNFFLYKHYQISKCQQRKVKIWKIYEFWRIICERNQIVFRICSKLQIDHLQNVFLSVTDKKEQDAHYSRTMQWKNILISWTVEFLEVQLSNPSSRLFLV